MALKQCPDCNTSMSRSAASCPACGYVPWAVRLRKVCFVVAAVSYGMMTLATNPADEMFLKLGVAGLMGSGVVLSALLAM
jgi:hypothetical protein